MPNLRIRCAAAVQNILENKVFFSTLKKNFAPDESAFANMLILSALRQWVGLNKILSGFLHKKIPHKHRVAQYLLLLAINEMLTMQTAPYAVINETVNNVRQTSDKFLSAMSNAVLRKIVADKEKWQQYLQKNTHLPTSFLPILTGYEKEQISDIDALIMQPPSLDLTVKSDVAMWAEKLGAEILPSGSLRLYNAAKVQVLDGYNEGAWWVQDAAAALPVLAMGEVKDLSVVDLCAAPGGKTAQLAALGAKVTAVDVSAERLKTLEQNMTRLGFAGIKTLAVDAQKFLQQTDELFDAILLDAPCSATGTFRRHPEVLHIKTIDDVKEQTFLQQKLLNAAASRLKIGGVLLYSVCSIAKAEGEEQIQKFLAAHTNLRLVPIKQSDIEKYGNWRENIITKEGYIHTLPYVISGGMDAFFIAKLQRII